MQHQSFLELLEKYQDTAPLEEYGVIKELRDYVAEHTDCFERKREDGAKHIATSVLLVTPDIQKALFLWHTKIQRWTQPGGHADGNSDIHAVALKELEEETGIKNAKLATILPIDIYRFDYPSGVFGYQKSIYNLFFMAILPENQEPKIMEPNKCEAMRWATPEEAMDMIKIIPHEGTERLIQKWQTLMKEYTR